MPKITGCIRAIDRVFQKAIGGPIRLRQPALAGVPNNIYMSRGGDDSRFIDLRHLMDPPKVSGGEIKEGRKGNYTVVRQFPAMGGMSIIYEVKDKQGETYLLKQIRPPKEWPESLLPSLFQRFDEEISTMERVDHRNIVKIIDRCKRAHSRFFVMEYVRGADLDSMVRKQAGLSGPLMPDHSVSIILSIVKGLWAMQQQAQVDAHRDLKPENILVGVRREAGKITLLPKVSDFGIVKIDDDPKTHEILFLGSPPWTAPELLPYNSIAANQVSDVYALGTILHFMLTGREPIPFLKTPEDGNTFRANATEIIANLYTRRPVEVPPWIWDITFMAMAAGPRNRFQGYLPFGRVLKCVKPNGLQWGKNTYDSLQVFLAKSEILGGR